MAPKKRTGRQLRSTDPADYGGLDPAFIKSIIDKIPANPITGRVDLNDIMTYMSHNPSEMETVMTQMDNLDIGTSNVDLSNYEFSSLKNTIVHESFWIVQLENMGIVDSNGRTIDPREAHRTPGAHPTFMVYCYDEKGAYRFTQEYDNLPTSDELLKIIKCSIAKPIPPLKPCLPWFLLVSSKFAQHVNTIRPFLDSLPAPFHWRVETAEEAESLNQGIHEQNQSGVAIGLRLGEKAKTAGNEAFAKKDRHTALQEYTTAINHYIDALSQKPDVEEEKKAERQLAICYANRAAAYLLPGEGQDLRAAIRDGEAAESHDKTYAKAYVRQATAYGLLSEKDKALDAIAKALRLPELEHDSGLVDRMIELQTEGKGLASDEAEFKDWLLDMMINDRASSKRIAGIKGEYRRRLDEHMAQWKR